MKAKIKNGIFYVIIVFLILMFFIYPTKISAAVFSALKLCAEIVIPSLFPFFILSMLFIKSGLCEKIGQFLSPILTPLFKLNSACSVVFILSLISGYPAGGVAAVTLYKQNGCTKRQCERLLGFCNNCGPAFIITAIGSSMLNNYFAGIMLYVIHIASAALIGIISARFFKKEKDTGRISHTMPHIKIMDVFIDSIKKSLAIMLEVCAVIITFCALISLIGASGILNVIYVPLQQIFNIPPRLTAAVITGFLELTNGANLVSLCKIDPVTTLVILSALIGFGGICVHIQLLSQIKDAGVSTVLYFIGKTAHAVISAAITFAVSKFLYKTTDVFSIKSTMESSALSVFINSTVLFLGVIFVLIIISFVLFKKKRQNI